MKPKNDWYIKKLVKYGIQSKTDQKEVVSVKGGTLESYHNYSSCDLPDDKSHIFEEGAESEAVAGWEK
jgi:hypothetical protein